MARVRFTGDFDWRVRHGVVVAYKQGHELTIPRAAANAALAAGKAEEIDPPPRRQRNVDAPPQAGAENSAVSDPRR